MSSLTPAKLQHRADRLTLGACREREPLYRHLREAGIALSPLADEPAT